MSDSEIRTTRELTPADISGKRQNRARGAVTQSEKAAIEKRAKAPERQIPIDLSAQVFAHRVDAEPDDSEDPLLIEARHAYTQMRENLADIYKREKAIWADESATPTFRILKVDRVARKRGTEPAEKLDAVRGRMNATIQEIDKEIEGSFRARMTPEEQREIRTYVQGLSSKARREFLTKADDDTLAAVLSGKPYLSGLEPAEAEKLKHETTARKFPDQIRRKAKLKKAIEQFDRGWDLYHGAVTKLYHADADEIARRARLAAEAAE